MSLEAASAYGLAINIAGISYMMFLGIATAASVNVAEAFGRSDQHEIIIAARTALVLCVGLGMLITIILFVFNNQIAQLMFILSPEKNSTPIMLFAGLISVTALVILGDGMQVVAAYTLRAQEIIWAPSFIHIGSYYVLMLPLGYIFAIPLAHGIYGLMWGVVAGCLAAGTLQTLLLEFTNQKGRKIPA